ncbi:MAG TPA: ABC transporter permease, partial [Geobacterales bacterium]|nr:ABC transporter permease [Geobacterales bacterium]
MDNFRRLVSYSRPYWGRMLIAALAALMVGGMDGACAFISGKLVKQLFAQSNYTYLNYIPLAIILIFVVRGLGRYINDYFIRTAGQLAIQ